MLEFNTLHLSIALGPLATYLLLLGVINLSSRPFLTNGARDTAALGVGLVGFVVVGPMELFLPEATAFRLGPLGWVVWVLLLVFYALCLTLVVLLMRPRLVIYNIRPDQLRPLLAEVVGQLDGDARWAGQCLIMPNLGIQLHVEVFAAMRNAQLVAAGPQQSFEGWQRMEVAMAAALRQTKSVRNPYGFTLVFAALLIVAVMTVFVVGDAEMVKYSLHEMLRLEPAGK